MRVLTADGDAVDADATDADAADADAADAGASCRITRGSSACASALLMVSTVRKISCPFRCGCIGNDSVVSASARWPGNRRAIAQLGQRGLQMKRHRVMDSAFDFVPQQRVPDRFAPGAANHEQMVAGFRAFGFEDRPHVQRREQLAIAAAISRRRSFHSSSFSSFARSTAACIVSSRAL